MNRIKFIRTQLGATQSAFAKGINVTQSNVSHYEKGQTVPPKVACRIIDFAKTLGVNISFDDVYATHSDRKAHKANGLDKTKQGAFAHD